MMRTISKLEEASLLTQERMFWFLLGIIQLVCVIAGRPIALNWAECAYAIVRDFGGSSCGFNRDRKEWDRWRWSAAWPKSSPEPRQHSTPYYQHFNSLDSVQG